MTHTWMHRLLNKTAVVLAGGAVGLSLLISGCSAQRHLHDSTGRAFYTVLYRQAKKAQRYQVPHPELMSGEEAAVVMENFEKVTKYSEFKQQGGTTLLPLQR